MQKLCSDRNIDCASTKVSNKILSEFRIRHNFQGMFEIRNNMYPKPERAAVMFKNKKKK